MKFIIYLLPFTLAILASCSDGLDTEVQTQDELKTRSFLPKRSPNVPRGLGSSNMIEIGNIGKVLLPWANGATTQVPVEVLNDYEERDGWMVLYNLCTPVMDSRFGNETPYLIFYNVFTGQLRCYAYVNNNVTNGNATFWQVSFNNNTYMTNDFDSVITAYDAGYNVKNLHAVSNLTRTPAKSLARGWNCFDIDLAIYDPDIRKNYVTMNIDVFDVTNLTLKLNGNSYAQTTGTIVSASQSSSVPLNLNTAAAKGSEIGVGALAKLLDIGDLPKSAVSTVVSKGVNNLVSKFLGKKTTSLDSSIVKLTTIEDIKMSGTISGNSQSNFPSLSQLVVPGAFRYDFTFDLHPYYDKPLGVFYIAKTPTLCLLDRYNVFVPTNSTTPPVHGEGGSSYQRMNIYGYFTIGCKEPIEVVLNPEVLSRIDHYTVSTAIVGDADLDFRPYVDSDGHDVGALSATVYGDRFFCTSNSDLASMMYIGKYASSVSIPKDPEDAAEYYDRYKNLVKPTMPSNVELKVTVTLYPKAPQYNPTPIVLTRTVKCNIERP